MQKKLQKMTSAYSSSTLLWWSSHGAIYGVVGTLILSNKLRNQCSKYVRVAAGVGAASLPLLNVVYHDALVREHKDWTIPTKYLVSTALVVASIVDLAMLACVIYPEQIRSFVKTYLLKTL